MTWPQRHPGAAKGRRFPVFGVGLGAGWFKLQVSPAKQALEIYRDADQRLLPFQWFLNL
jgi:hypothetical protein